MATPLTRRKLLKVFSTARLLAEKCECHESYVSRWGDDEPIPESFELKLLYRTMPELRKRPAAESEGINWAAWDRLTGEGKRAAA